MKSPDVTDFNKTTLKDSVGLWLVTLISYDMYIPESNKRLIEVIIGKDIVFSGINNISATVIRIANRNVTLDARDTLIPDKVWGALTLSECNQISIGNEG